MSQLLYWNQLAAGQKDERDGAREGGREGEVGTITFPKDGGTHPTPGDAVVQLEILLPTSGNQWLCYCQILDLWCLDTKVLMLISAGCRCGLRPEAVFNLAASQAGGLGTALGPTCLQQSNREQRGCWCRFGEADKSVDGKEGMAWQAWVRSRWQQGTGIIPMLGERNEIWKLNEGKSWLQQN